jgi:hypothetical protein
LNGGAIYSKGTLTIANCTFSSNRAVPPAKFAYAQGGAIFNDVSAKLIATNCTFASNRVDTNGVTLDAGIPVLMAGGAIFSVSDTALTITNSTFAGNRIIAPSVTDRTKPYTIEGGAIYAGATLTLTNCTFSANNILTNLSRARGGAISVTRNATVSGTILAASQGGNCNGSFAASYDLSDDASCRLSGTSRDNVTDIDLDTGLENNGGPTQTIALTSVMSAAVDLIPPMNCPKTDQRGFVRPAPGQAQCDAGAFELGAMPPPP